jgi:hypothetical protein
MKFILFLSLALSLPAFAEPGNDPYTLSGRPWAYVENGQCTITGALWADDAVPHAKLQLVEIAGTRVIDVQTDRSGIYHVTIPVSGKTVFQEQMPRSARAVLTGSRIPQGGEWTNPTVVCGTGTVEIGPIQSVG